MTSDGRTKRLSHETNHDGPIHDQEPQNNMEPSKEDGENQGVKMESRQARVRRQSDGITESVTDGLEDVPVAVVDTTTNGPNGDEGTTTYGPTGDEGTTTYGPTGDEDTITDGPTGDDDTTTYGPIGDDDTYDTYYIEHWDYYSEYYDDYYGDDDDETDTENGTFLQETPIMAGMPTHGDDWELEDDFDEDQAHLLRTPKDGLKTLQDEIKTKIKEAPSGLIKVIGHQKEDMVISFSFAGRKQKIADIEQVTSPHYGNCYKISSKKYKAWRSGPDHGMKLILNLETGEYMSGFASGYGIRVAFNEPGSLAMPNEEGITVSSGFDTSIGLRTVQISRLAEPYGNCSDGAEFFKRYNRKYTVAACMEFCRVDQVIETCRCLPFDAPETYSNADYDNIDVCKPLPHKDEACVVDVEFKLDDGEVSRCDCPTACNEIVYDKALSGRFWPTDDYLSKGLMREVCKRNIPSMTEACSHRKNGTFDPAMYKKDFLTIRIYYEDLNYESIAEEPMYGRVDREGTEQNTDRQTHAETFISYPDVLHEHVKQELIPAVQDKTGHLIDLFEYQFRPGGSIDEEILNCLDTCRRLIFILSHDTLRDDIKMMILKYAMAKNMTCDYNFLLVFTYRQVSASLMTVDVRDYIDKHVTVRWEDGDFLNRLATALKYRKHVPVITDGILQDEVPVLMTINNEVDMPLV